MTWTQDFFFHFVGLTPSSGSNGSSGIFNMKIDTFDHKALLGPPKIPGLHPDSVQLVPSSTENSNKNKNKKKKNKNNNNSNSSAIAVSAVNNDFVPPPVGGGDSHVITEIDPAKKLRNLRKKLRDIETLEKKLADGDLKHPEPEQLEKVARKPVMLKEIADLESAISKLST